jgi:hypothetical protein
LESGGEAFNGLFDRCFDERFVFIRIRVVATISGIKATAKLLGIVLDQFEKSAIFWVHVG